ncbi:hypothetical protein BASA81_001425 [Batrachochytrium salamandrivorans]|nr:hypothetical protein BASA81_001425 [Batrachochytrium salamandrivorans]
MSNGGREEREDEEYAFNYDREEEREIFASTPLPTIEHSRLAKLGTVLGVEQKEYDWFSQFTQESFHSNNNSNGGEEDEEEKLEETHSLLDLGDNPYINVTSAAMDLAQGWSLEHFTAMAIVATSTCLFYLLPPALHPLQVRLDFTFLFTSMLYQFTFLSTVTFRRRDEALDHIGRIRTLMCQIQRGLLLWNRSRPRPHPNFANEVNENLVQMTECCFMLLKLPTIPDFTRLKRDSYYRLAIRKRTQQLRIELMKNHINVHLQLEACKQDNSVETHETTRLTDYARMLHVEMEQLQLLKEYRTPQSARDFQTVQLLLLPAVWGAYFSIIAADHATFAYSFLLALVSMFITLILVNLMRAMEDPFLSRLRGENLGQA